MLAWAIIYRPARRVIEVEYWAVVQSEPQRERVVQALLARRGLQTYLPWIKPRGERIQPLFPSYIFVRICNFWWDVRWTPHVVRILMDGTRPAKLRDEIVDQIRGREKNGLIMLPKADDGFQKGQKVQVSNGNFAGHIGVYDGMRGEDRERVLLELLGQSVPVELPLGVLIACSPR